MELIATRVGEKKFYLILQRTSVCVRRNPRNQLERWKQTFSRSVRTTSWLFWHAPASAFYFYFPPSVVLLGVEKCSKRSSTREKTSYASTKFFIFFTPSSLTRVSSPSLLRNFIFFFCFVVWRRRCRVRPEDRWSEEILRWSESSRIFFFSSPVFFFSRDIVSRPEVRWNEGRKKRKLSFFVGWNFSRVEMWNVFKCRLKGWGGFFSPPSLLFLGEEITSFLSVVTAPRVHAFSRHRQMIAEKR